MSEPTLGLTFQSLIIRVAEYLGVADYSGGAAAVPSDAHDLDLCKRLVNDGYRRFIDTNPKWKFLTPLFTITFDPNGGATTVGGDAARYYMPDGFYGELVSPWTYTGGAGPFRKLDQVDEGVIRELNSTATTTGDPSYVAVRPLQATVSQNGKRWEAIFWPTPNTARAVTARARVYPDAMVNNGDRHVCGPQHDGAIIAAALAEAEINRNDTIGPRSAAWAEALARSIRTDAQAGDKRIGDYGDKSEDRLTHDGRPSSYARVDTYNGVSVD